MKKRRPPITRLLRVPQKIPQQVPNLEFLKILYHNLLFYLCIKINNNYYYYFLFTVPVGLMDFLFLFLSRECSGDTFG